MVAYNSDRKSYFTDLQNQVTFSETQTGNKVKRLHLDNTPEFVSGQVKDWYKSKGIRLEPTTTYIPEQNGISKRSIHTIIESEHTELEQSGLPYEFWEEAAIYGIYAYNRYYLPKIGITPYEAFYRAKPDVSNLYIFGSLVYVYIPKEITS
jgi:transposase InsO family protein